MASHGSSKHLKRLAAPRAIAVERKRRVWLKKPSPGPHGQAVALSTALTEQLRLVETLRQAKKLVAKKEIIVDGGPVSDASYPLGLMDCVQIPKLNKTYLMLFKKGLLVPQETDSGGVKLCRVMDKTIVKGGRIQLNLHDGTNYMIVKEEDRFKVGDTIKISVPGRALQGFLKMEKGATCYICEGKHSGEIAVLDELLQREGSKKTEARLKAGGHDMITLKDYLFVVDPSFKVNA